MLQYSSIRAFLYPTSSRAKVIKINLASWHALFAKAHTLQLLRASIIRKCNKIRQTDYISKLRSKIKHNLGPPIMGVVLIERQPLCGIIVMPGCSGLIGGVWHGHSFTSLRKWFKLGITINLGYLFLTVVKILALYKNIKMSRGHLAANLKYALKFNGLKHIPLLNKTI